MNCLDLSLPSPAENLACDEALLDLCEAGELDETLRFWEPTERFVVVGYANREAHEVNLPACRADNLPVLRRCSGGGTVLQGPGCLNYSVILRITQPGPLAGITTTNAHILQRHQAALAPLLAAPVEMRGHTDLTVGQLKFSGNAQRRKNRFLIFHGTFLLHFNIAEVEKYLELPSVRPDYRQNRPHADFLTNLNLPAAMVKSALQNAWDARTPLTSFPREKISPLVPDRIIFSP